LSRQVTQEEEPLKLSARFPDLSLCARTASGRILFTATTAWQKIVGVSNSSQKFLSTGRLLDPLLWRALQCYLVGLLKSTPAELFDSGVFELYPDVEGTEDIQEALEAVIKQNRDAVLKFLNQEEDLEDSEESFGDKEAQKAANALFGVFNKFPDNWKGDQVQ
jgi:hypothetical protein